MVFYKEEFQLMKVREMWNKLSTRQKSDIKSVIMAMVEFDAGLINEDGYYSVLDSIEPMRVRCAVCLYRHDYNRAMEYMEQLIFYA